MANLQNFIGTKVTHSEYGSGTIRAIRGAELTVRFDGDDEDCYFDADCLGKVLIPGRRAEKTKPKPKPTSYPPIESVVGMQVRHKKFGLGRIVEAEDATLTVEYDGRRQGKYGYPDCFRQHLQFVQPSALPESAALYFRHTNRRTLRRRDDVPECCSLGQLRDIFVPALDAEISFIRQNGSGRRKIRSGQRLKHSDGTTRWLYVFETAEELQIPADTRVTLYEKNTPVAEAVVFCCEDFSIVLEVDCNLGDKVAELDLEADLTILLRNLCSRVEEMSDGQHPIARDLCTQGFSCALDADIAVGQKTATELAQTQPITFIWGPPGTGKTKVLADIALAHVRAKRRVLIMSHSNIAVDSAALRVLETAGTALKPGELVRYGYPRKTEVLEHPFLTSYSLALYQNPSERLKREHLLTKRDLLPANDPESVAISKELGELRKKLKQHERELVTEAQCVATTLSKAASDPALYQLRFDVVIVDEASMAYVPQLVFAASLAEHNFVCVGDFAQLPPIVQNDAENNPLKLDIFRFCGVSQAVQSRLGHEWLCLLDEQFRMDPVRAKFVSDRMYDGRLRSSTYADQNTRNLVGIHPFAGSSFGLLDLTGAVSTCVQLSSGSKLNVLSALCSVELARQLSASGTVGIISPFRAQADLLNALVRDAAEAGEEWTERVSCATVHQFQGSEMDHVVFDVTECYRSTYLARLLQSPDDYADRLMNVAMTRARGKFIVVANRAFLRRRNLKPESMLGALMEQIDPAEDTNPEWLRTAAGSRPGAWQYWGTEKNGLPRFLADLRKAGRRIRFDVPGTTSGAEQEIKAIAAALKDAKRRDLSITIRGELRGSVPEPWKHLSLVDRKAVNPLALIDESVLWFGLPSSGAAFYHGRDRLNTTFRPVVRLEGERTCRMLASVFDMDHQRVTGRNGKFAEYVAAHCSCSRCGRPMLLRSNKSRQNSFFLGCSGYPACRGGSTRPLSAELVQEYLAQKEAGRCPVCQKPLKVQQVRDTLYVTCSSGEHRFNLLEI